MRSQYVPPTVETVLEFSDDDDQRLSSTRRSTISTSTSATKKGRPAPPPDRRALRVAAVRGEGAAQIRSPQPQPAQPEHQPDDLQRRLRRRLPEPQDVGATRRRARTGGRQALSAARQDCRRRARRAAAARGIHREPEVHDPSGEAIERQGSPGRCGRGQQHIDRGR